LAESPAGAVLLIDAAAADPRLFGPASRAIITHTPGPESLSRLAGLPVIDPNLRDAAIVELGAKLGAEDLATAVGTAALSAQVREAVLARLADADRERTPGVVDGLMMLAEARVELRKAADALAVLRSVDPALLGESQARQHAKLSLIATVLSGDLQAADALDAQNAQTLEDWLAAWRLTPESSVLRRSVASALLERFADQVTDAIRLELGQTTPESKESPSDQGDAAPSEPQEPPTEEAPEGV
jgi:hypothetical protein